MTIPQSTSNPSSDTRHGLYCPACNAKFDLADGGGACPRCGALPEVDHSIAFADTMLLRDPEGADVPQQHPPTQNGGEELLGKELDIYHCRALLGRGGMGRVYLAHHQRLGRDCALKILPKELQSRDPDFVQRFQNEGRAAAALVHHNIVTVHAIGESRGYHFLEMEYIAGRSLQQVIRSGPLTPLRATIMTQGIAAGLEAAHRAGILHRDLKPDNVLLSPRGIPKIADFGLAKKLNRKGELSGEILVGTPNYMAPELFRGEHSSPASDVYSLGVCYFAMLTGRLPYSAGRISQLMSRVATEPLPNVREINPEITLEMAECLAMLMSKDPASRPADAIAALQLISAVVGQLQDLESLLADAIAPCSNFNLTRVGNHFEIKVNLADGRRQTVFVESSDHDVATRLVSIYTICGPAQAELYEQALRLNASVSHGALAIRDIEGIPHLVMVDTYPRATVDPEEIRATVLELALQADRMERRMTEVDRH